MAKNELSSARVAAIAARAILDPGSLTLKEIQTLAGSVLTQVADKPRQSRKPAKKKKRKVKA